MELLALGQEGLQQGDADGPAQVAGRVEQAQRRRPACSGSMAAIAMADSGAIVKACARARTRLEPRN